MQINSVNNNSAYNPGTRNHQSTSIEQKIKKLEDRKRKIEEDLATPSNNPDPKAAQGDNAANSAVNRRILQQIEQQIQTLEQRGNSTKKENIPNSKSAGSALSVCKEALRGSSIDLLA